MNRLLLTLALVAAPATAAGQSVLETVWYDLRHVPGDLWYVWSAPARIDGDDVPELVTFTWATGALAVSDLQIQEWIREHPNSVPIEALEPFRHRQDGLSRIGQNHWVLRGAGVGYVVGLVTGHDGIREAALGCAVGNTANALPRKVVYALISRRRPSRNDDPFDIGVPGGDWAEHSFFGGHAANAFSCGSLLAHRFELGWAEPVVWGVAVGVAAARTVDEAHWASDTLVGSAFGFMAGRLIAQRQLERHGERGRDDEEEQGNSGATDGADRRAWRLEGMSVSPVTTAEGESAMMIGGRIVF